MFVLIQNLINLFGIKVYVTFLEKLELEFLEKEIKNKEKVEVNGIP